MTVKEIVKDYLEKNGYDGLCSEQCGCGLDGLMPCSCVKNEVIEMCEAAYKHEMKESGGLYGANIPQVRYTTRKPK